MLGRKNIRREGVSLEKAEDIVVDCIKDGMKTVKE